MAITFYREVKFNFSSSREIATYLKETHLDTQTIVASEAPQASAILPYLGQKEFWYPEIDAFGSYLVFNKKGRMPGLSNDEVLTAVAKRPEILKDALLLLTTPLAAGHLKNYRLIFSSDLTRTVEGFGHGAHNSNDEVYFLYSTTPLLSSKPNRP